MSDIDSISGDFVQEKRLDYLSQPLISRGFFYFSRPDTLTWEYRSPAPNGLEILNGRVRAWTGPPNDRRDQPEALAKAAGLAAGQVMLWMDLNPEAISAAYRVEIIGREPLKLEVIPKRAQIRKQLSSITVEFSERLNTVRQVHLIEPEGRTVITFNRVKLNQPRPSR